MATIDESRHEERAQYGETVYLLQPNVKRSPGGLRDIQLIRWLGFARYGEAGPGTPGSVMTANFELMGQEFMVLNGGPHYELSPAFSMFVSCESQEEVDTLWDALLEGGRPNQCGWLQDRYGLSWQIIPTALMELMGDPDPEKSQRVMEAMLKMVKIEVPLLQAAYDGV